MPLDESIGVALLRGVLTIARFAAEWLFDIFFAWIGKGVLFCITFGRFNPDLDEGREYMLACAVGVVASVALVWGMANFLPQLRIDLK